jgi:DnaK suppressor protein
MKAEEKKKLLTLIENQIRDTKAEISELVELTKPVSLDASIGRVSRMDAINNKSINDSALREKKGILQKLERAVERSEKDDFGNCMKCGEEIPFGRLEYMPYTTRCVKCA